MQMALRPCGKVRAERTEEGRTLEEAAIDFQVAARFQLPMPCLLAPQMAIGVMYLRWQLLHVVAFSQKLNRMRLLSSWPAPSTMMRYRQGLRARVAAAAEPPAEDLARIGTNPNRGMPADKILRWIEATKFIRNVSQHREAAQAWATLFFPDGLPAGLDSVIPRSDQICATPLRKVRVKVDIVAMLLFRD